MRIALLLFLAAIALPIAAQSPNTASLLVKVVDQNGAVVKGAKVAVTNNESESFDKAMGPFTRRLK